MERDNEGWKDGKRKLRVKKMVRDEKTERPVPPDRTAPPMNYSDFVQTELCTVAAWLLSICVTACPMSSLRLLCPQRLT